MQLASVGHLSWLDRDPVSGRADLFLLAHACTEAASGQWQEVGDPARGQQACGQELRQHLAVLCDQPAALCRPIS